MPALPRPLAAALAAAAVGALAGCATEAPAPVPTETVFAPPEFDPAGGAAGNLDYFRYILQMAAQDGTSDAELRETVAVGGFDGWPTESSGDATTLSGVAVDTHEISVLGPDGLCLLGSVGGDGSVGATVANPMSSTGKCRIGSDQAAS